MAYGYSVAEPKQHFSLKKALKYEQMMQDALKREFCDIFYRGGAE
jgi:hypothetical protein